MKTIPAWRFDARLRWRDDQRPVRFPPSVNHERPPADAPSDAPLDSNVRGAPSAPGKPVTLAASARASSDALPLSRLRMPLTKSNAHRTSNASRFAHSDARSRRPRRASASQRRSWGSPVALVVIPTLWVFGHPPTRLRGATGGSLCRCSFGRCGSHSAGQHSSPEWRLRRLQRQRRSAAGSPSVRMLAQPHSRACRLAPGGPLQARCWWPVRLGPTGLPGNHRQLLSFHFILALLSKFCFTCSPL